MTRIILLQPGYAHYRNKLFSILSKRHGIHFVYGSIKSYYYDKGKPDAEIYYSYVDQQFKSRWLGIVYFLLKEKPDIVISSNASSDFTLMSYIYSKLFRKKMILWILDWKKQSFDIINFKNILINMRNKVANLIILKCDALVVGGTAAYNYARSLGRSRDGMFIAMQSSNDISLQQTQEASSEKIKKFTFLYLSRIIPLKGLDLLIRAFSQLEKNRDDVSLLIAGDGPFKDYCLNLSKELKINNIEFLGGIDPSHTKEIFTKADVFVLPSYFLGNLYESWGLVINEAMSMELPIITTTGVGASTDLVENGVNGFVVKQNDVTELYHAMKKILDCDLKKMGQVSRRIFEEKNDFIKMADAFTSAINYVNE